MELQDQWEEFADRNTIAVALAQEDTDLESHGQILAAFQPDLPFDVVADLNHEQTPLYDRTTTYLIDREGNVREVFPALIHMRPTWQAVLHRLDQVIAEDEKDSGSH